MNTLVFMLVPCVVTTGRGGEGGGVYYCYSKLVRYDREWGGVATTRPPPLTCLYRLNQIYLAVKCKVVFNLHYNSLVQAVVASVLATPSYIYFYV